MGLATDPNDGPERPVLRGQINSMYFSPAIIFSGPLNLENNIKNISIYQVVDGPVICDYEIRKLVTNATNTALYFELGIPPATKSNGPVEACRMDYKLMMGGFKLTAKDVTVMGTDSVIKTVEINIMESALRI